MIADKAAIEFSAKLIGEIDSGEKQIFLENVNTDNELYANVFYKPDGEPAGVFFSCVYCGFIRMHIAFVEDSADFNETLSSLIISSLQKSGLRAGRIWIKNDHRVVIEYVRRAFRISPNCGVYDYASEEFILRRENFSKGYADPSLLIKPFEAKHVDEYLTMLDDAMNFANPAPNYVGHKGDYVKLLEEKSGENSFEAFWKDGELAGLYWRDGAEIEIMAVSVHHRRRGYGRAILSRAIQMALETTCKDFAYLYVVDWNEKGRAFYRKYGMELNAHSHSFSVENFHE